MELGSPAFKIRKLLNDSNLVNREDRISKLPNEIIAHIFSFLPTKQVGRTSILSKKWRYAWIYHPNLEFDDQLSFENDPDVDLKLAHFKDSVDHALFYHGESAVEKCSFHCHTHQVSPYLYGWICAVLCSNVQRLSIKSEFNVQPLPPSLFTCRTLVFLEIEGPFLLNLPFYVRFPCLKTLSLESVIFGDDLSMQRLFSSCPLLEDLKMCRERWDGVLIASISIPSLKRLCIIQSYLGKIDGQTHKMVIDAPNLEHLELDNCAKEVFEVNFSGSLVQAVVNGRYGPNILHGISRVKELLLYGNAFKRLQNQNALLPVFPNLIHLQLGVKRGWNFLENLLASTPNIETLVFEEGLLEPTNLTHSGFSSFYWDPPESPPACLRLNLKDIEIHNFVGRPCERFLIRYLLENSLVLDNMSIYWYSSRQRLTKLESVSYDKIMSYERGSPSCQVEFFGACS